MQFVCRTCGKQSSDIDMILDGECSCGGSHFKLISEEPVILPISTTAKEQLRMDLHNWIDLNLDSLDTDSVGDIRVAFELCNDELRR